MTDSTTADAGDPFDFAAPAEVFTAHANRSRPGMRFKGFDTSAEAIRYIMERPRAAGEPATLECNEIRYGMGEITALYHDVRYPLPRAEQEPEIRPAIAVPVSRGPLRMPRPEAPPLRRPDADTASTTRPLHRFRVGARLRMNHGGNAMQRRASYCRVTFLLPYEGGQLLYRVKSEAESFERVVTEVDLSPA